RQAPPGQLHTPAKPAETLSFSAKLTGIPKTSCPCYLLHESICNVIDVGAKKMPKQFWGKFRLAGAAAGVTALLATLPVDAEAASPFRQLAGTWKGAGQIMLSSGARERLSCRGYYTSRGTGNTLSLAIRCASP